MSASEIYERLLRGEATSEEYVAAVQAEARERAPAYGPQSRWAQLRRERDEAVAENARLREELAHYKLGPGVVSWAEVERLREALRTAADDLAKAANQFEGLKLAHEAGHPWPVVQNPRIFSEKAERARNALNEGQR